MVSTIPSNLCCFLLQLNRNSFSCYCASLAVLQQCSPAKLTVPLLMLSNADISSVSFVHFNVAAIFVRGGESLHMTYL